jgi:hypothetical protein
MTVNVSKPAINLRELLAKINAIKPAAQRYTFWFDGDSSNTTFSLPKGWKPIEVFVNGSIYRPGSSEDYEITYDGFVYSVEMSVAPAVVDVGIVAEREG